MPTLFISDLHLEDKRPAMTAVMLEFLRTAARKADALYILGDLFEYWIGDDVLSTTATDVATAISALRNSRVPCYFMHGNRDFLIGQAWAAEAGLEILPEEIVVDLYGQATLLLHGDSLCTDDAGYQAFRRQVRDPAWQSGFLSTSVDQRQQVAQNARAASEKHTGNASMEIMDVNQQAVIDAMRRHGVQRMIHGHTHRPAFHELEVDGVPARRIVLADWYERGSMLEISPAAEVMRPLDAVAI
jgi:UDP-2,3-diacylglucosamine hydrolase